MLSRSRLLLFESDTRAPLKLLQEMDAELRKAERNLRASPGDPQARQQHRHLKLRAGPPDQEHNWRFNGKGWFTRPAWNGGRCPPDSEPTQHNTCIHPDDSDRQQYKTIEKPKASYAHPGDEERDTHWKKRAEITRSAGVENSAIHPKRATRVNWDHPHGPQLYAPYDAESARPLPKSPEHLPRDLARGPGDRNGSWRDREHAQEMDRLRKHYVDAGYDEKFVRQALAPREQHVDSGALSQADLERLPDDRGVQRRAMRKAAEGARKRREADYAAMTQQWADDHGEPWPGDGYEDYDDYDYDDDRYDGHGYDDDQESPIGGYKNHPGYPGHPDFPQFDGQTTGPDPDEQRYRLMRHRWDPYQAAPEETPDERESQFTGPRGRGEPSWPRTGQRTGRDWEDF